MTLYLCHNCSNLDSPSGEACNIEAFHGVDQERILHGANDCVMGYMRAISDDERRKYAPLILPDEMSIDTDFYKLESHEADENFLNILSKPLWICNYFTYYKSNEDQLWDQAREQIYQFRQAQRRARWDEFKRIEINKEAKAFFNQAVPCISDPLNSCGMIE